MIITISREAFSNGSLIGKLVGERLHLQVFDGEVVDEIARRLHVDPKILTLFDETVHNPVESLLLDWRTSVNEQIYVHYLREALRRIARVGNAVIIGRGANFVLRGPEVLQVRIIAPMPLRIAIYQAAHNCTEPEAERAVREKESQRNRFIQTHFQHAANDPAMYDLVVNMAELTPEMAAEIIVQAAQLSRAQPAPNRLESLLPMHISLMAHHMHHVRPKIAEHMK